MAPEVHVKKRPQSHPQKHCTYFEFPTKRISYTPSIYKIGVLLSSIANGEDHHPLKIIGGKSGFRQFINKCLDVEPQQVKEIYERNSR